MLATMGMFLQDGCFGAALAGGIGFTTQAASDPVKGEANAGDDEVACPPIEDTTSEGEALAYDPDDGK
eukprot:1868065-Prorocentrum_lima.AAC.1